MSYEKHFKELAVKTFGSYKETTEYLVIAGFDTDLHGMTLIVDKHEDTRVQFTIGGTAATGTLPECDHLLDFDALFMPVKLLKEEDVFHAKLSGSWLELANVVSREFREWLRYNAIIPR